MTGKLEYHRDWREFIECLNANQVEFLIVGALAVARHVRPRYTKDMDVWVNPTAANGERVLSALRQFGFPIVNIEAAEFTNSDLILQFGVEPVRIDVITGISGVPEFAQAWEERSPGLFAGIPVNYLGRDTLRQNKIATGRPQDLVDVRILEIDDEETGR